jgi:hypothetical protein
MADLVITAAQVKLLNGTPKRGIAGVALAAGQAFYIDTLDGNRFKLADANGFADARVCAGIVLNNAAVDQPVQYADAGQIRLSTGSTVGLAGLMVVLSGNPGQLAPHTDLTTGWQANLIGFLDSTGKILNLALATSGVTLP